jgi:hypothetical protein
MLWVADGHLELAWLDGPPVEFPPPESNCRVSDTEGA